MCKNEYFSVALLPSLLIIIRILFILLGFADRFADTVDEFLVEDHQIQQGTNK